MTKTAIIAAKRSPFGKFKGSLSHVKPDELLSPLIKNVTSILPSDQKIDKIIIGQAIQAGSGQNVARTAALKAQLDEKIPAMTINQVCGSSLQTLILADQLIRLGDADCLVVGGVESMTLAPRLEDKQTQQVTDSLNDGLMDAVHHIHMGITAENVAQHYHIAREAQDQFAFESQQKASQAQQQGIFKSEILPFNELEQDECIRHQVDLTKMATLSPAFKTDGTVTAGNSSVLSDGACVLLVMNEKKAQSLNLPILATIEGTAEVGLDPLLMGMGPVPAIQALVQKTGHSLEQIDRFELNEAFASQSIACVNELQLPKEKVNIHGGAIALGHPLAASGARLITHLVHTMNKNERAIAALCVGGGMGLAIEILKH